MGENFFLILVNIIDDLGRCIEKIVVLVLDSLDRYGIYV